VQSVGEVGPKDDERAVREIDDVHDSPDEREAQRYESKDPGKKERIDGDLTEFGGGHGLAPE
jgi:hypothetical protein